MSIKNIVKFLYVSNYSREIVIYIFYLSAIAEKTGASEKLNADNTTKCIFKLDVLKAREYLAPYGDNCNFQHQSIFRGIINEVRRQV